MRGVVTASADDDGSQRKNGPWEKPSHGINFSKQSKTNPAHPSSGDFEKNPRGAPHRFRGGARRTCARSNPQSGVPDCEKLSTEGLCFSPRLPYHHPMPRPPSSGTTSIESIEQLERALSEPTEQ